MQHGLFVCFKLTAKAHPHAALAESEEARLRAHSLDVSPGEFILGHDEYFEVNIFTQSHAARVDSKNVPLSLEKDRVKGV